MMKRTIKCLSIVLTVALLFSTGCFTGLKIAERREEKKIAVGYLINMWMNVGAINKQLNEWSVGNAECEDKVKERLEEIIVYLYVYTRNTSDYIAEICKHPYNNNDISIIEDLTVFFCDFYSVIGGENTRLYSFETVEYYYADGICTEAEERYIKESIMIINEIYEKIDYLRTKEAVSLDEVRDALWLSDDGVNSKVADWVEEGGRYIASGKMQDEGNDEQTGINKAKIMVSDIEDEINKILGKSEVKKEEFEEYCMYFREVCNEAVSDEYINTLFKTEEVKESDDTVKVRENIVYYTISGNGLEITDVHTEFDEVWNVEKIYVTEGIKAADETNTEIRKYVFVIQEDNSPVLDGISGIFSAE